MSRHHLQLNCTACNAFEDYVHDDSDPDGVVRCDECGKKHGSESVMMVDRCKTYERDEAGNLLEAPL